MTTRFASVRDLINGLGGTQAVADLCGVKRNAVSNWRVRNHLPPSTFKEIQAQMIARGCTADIGLWNWDRKKRVANE